MRFIFETIIIFVFGITAIFLYMEYWDDLQYALFGESQHYTVYLGQTAIDVTVADEYAERILGLSGVPKLKDFEGKLFIFNEDAKHGIWMKDMLIPIDIIWIDKDMRVVDIEENVQPNTYPTQIFAPQTEARFVLEMNAHFVSSVKIKVGDRLLLPPSLLPADVEQSLQQ